jgi:uncharacterized protein YfaP (DUF2135 family)
MNKKSYVGASILALALILAGSASAFASDSHKVKLPFGMTLGGTQLAAGEYHISWVTHSPEATVTVAQKQSVVATVEGRLVESDKTNWQNAVIYDDNPDGTRKITEIRMAGSKKVLVFD